MSASHPPTRSSYPLHSLPPPRSRSPLSPPLPPPPSPAPATVPSQTPPGAHARQAKGEGGQYFTYLVR